MKRKNDAEMFPIRHKRILRKYGDIIKPSQNEFIAMDIIEAWEDMRKIKPLLGGLIGGRSSKDEAEDALMEVWGRAWHIIVHLQRLAKALDVAFDDDVYDDMEIYKI